MAIMAGSWHELLGIILIVGPHVMTYPRKVVMELEPRVECLSIMPKPE